MAIEISIIQNDQEVVRLPATTRDAKNPFSTGSRGFNANGKITFGGKTYQASINLVEVGSLVKTKTKK